MQVFVTNAGKKITKTTVQKFRLDDRVSHPLAFTVANGYRRIRNKICEFCVIQQQCQTEHKNCTHTLLYIRTISNKGFNLFLKQIRNWQLSTPNHILGKRLGS
jgi:hypothetical protein